MKSLIYMIILTYKFNYIIKFHLLFEDFHSNCYPIIAIIGWKSKLDDFKIYFLNPNFDTVNCFQNYSFSFF